MITRARGNLDQLAAVCTLLEPLLDRFVLEAWRALPSRAVPHGVRYSLTLHDPYGKRILGYDNAHAVSAPRNTRYKGRIVAHDHKHRGRADKGVPYEFQDAYQLLADFLGDVDRVLGQVRK